jgi:outer membrane protein TolC
MEKRRQIGLIYFGGVVAILALLTAGCETYHPMVLDQSAAARALQPKNLESVRAQAGRIRHPILKPVEIDLQNGLSPHEAAILAVLLNPKLKAERDKRGVSAAQLYQAGILPNPQFSGSLDFPTGGSTQGTVNGFGFGIDYDIRALITRGADLTAARAQAASVDLEVAWQEWQVAEAAKRHTFRLFLLEKQLSVAEKEEKGLKENLASVKQAVRLHYMTILDLAAAQASLEKVHLSVLGIEQNLAQERIALNNTIGLPPDHRFHPERDIILPGAEAVPSLEGLMDGITDRRLDLLALKMGYDSQEAHVRAAILGQFPRITTGFSEARDTGNVLTSGFSVTIGLPFFDRNQGKIAVERATRKQLFDEYMDRLFEARSNLARFRANIESIDRQIGASQAYLPTLKNLVDTYYLALLQGNADVLTYYNKRDELIGAQIALLDLRLQLVDQVVALEIAAGEYLGQSQGEKETQ